MIQIFINNEEVVCDKNLTITEEMLTTSSTILNNCYPKSWENDKDYVSRFYFPQDYAKCKILKNSNLIFCGVVKNTGNISLNPRYPHYCNLQILDFKTLLSEGKTLDFVISDKTVFEAIQMVIDAVADYGVELGTININGADDVIGAYSTLDKTAYDVFQYLADITGSRWTTRMVDENSIAVDFYDPELLPRKDNIQYTTEYFESNNIDDITFSYSTSDYRNKQVILSDEIYADIDYNEQVIANGYQTAFNTMNNIAVFKSVKVDGVEKTFASNEEKSLGIKADFYYTLGSTSFESEEVMTAGSKIVVQYIPYINGRQIVTDENESQRINSQTGRNGIISRYEKRNDILNSDELNKVAQTYIKYKGSAEVTLTIKTEDNDLFDVGNIVYFDAPIADLKQDYMVKKKTMQMIMTTSKVFYTYELTSSFNSENAINYFDNQRSKNSGNIKAGDFITRNVDIEIETLIVYNSASKAELDIKGNNILNCALNSPFSE